MSRAKLDGKVAVVTGAARGLGALLAQRLSERGARLALLGLEPAGLERVSSSLPGDSAYWVVNVTDRAGLADAAGEVTDRFGGVDILVSNAGVAVGGLFTDPDVEAFDRVLEVNLCGSIDVVRAFLPELLRSKGYLLQIASLAAIAHAPTMTAYCASKAGVEAFAHALRTELGYLGVDVGVAYLSFTDTDMLRGADADEVLREMRANLPWPTNRTYPPGPAVDRLAAGIERRAAHVYGQRWLRGMQVVRGLVPTVLGSIVGPRQMRRFAPLLEATRDARHGLAGPGGAADERSRRPPSSP